jgi:hypothetical protein
MEPAPTSARQRLRTPRLNLRLPTPTVAQWCGRPTVQEIFAVVRPDNTRAAATVRNNGMHWVGETTKYFGVELQVFRLRMADINRAAPEGHHPPN